MEEIKLDCMYEMCPIPLLRAMEKLKKMDSGDVLILQINYSCSIKNVVEWAEKQGHAVNCIEVEDGEWEVYIKKK